MPSTYTLRFRFTLEAPGENLNTWGSILNTGAIALIDDAIGGYVSKSVSGNITLTSANGSTDEARMAILDFTSGTGGNVTIPAVSKVYQARNNTSGNVVITTGSGTSATIEAGSLATVIVDGANVRRMTDAADVAAALAAAKAYTDAAAFASASGNLPGQSGNAGKYLSTNGSNAIWTDVGNTTGNSGSATKLATPRSISIAGDGNATIASFDGSANVSANLTLGASGVTPGTYNNASVTVDGKGRVTAAANATPRNISLTGDGNATIVGFDGSANVSGNFTLGPSGVTAGAYTNASVTVDSKGRVTAASSGSSAPFVAGRSTAGSITGVLGDAQTVITLTSSGASFNIPDNSSVAYPIGAQFIIVGVFAGGSFAKVQMAGSDNYRGNNNVGGTQLVIVTKIGSTLWHGTAAL